MKTAAPDLPEILTVEHLSAYFDRSERWVRAFLRSGRGPVYRKQGAALLVHRDALRGWLSSPVNVVTG